MLCLVWAAVVAKTGRNSLSRLLCLQNWFIGRYWQARESMLEFRRGCACFWGLWIFMYLEISKTTCFPGQGFFREGMCKGSPREEGWVKGLPRPSEPGRPVMQGCQRPLLLSFALQWSWGTKKTLGCQSTIKKGGEERLQGKWWEALTFWMDEKFRLLKVALLFAAEAILVS